jgi:hypothetical protein
VFGVYPQGLEHNRAVLTITKENQILETRLVKTWVYAIAKHGTNLTVDRSRDIQANEGKYRAH